MMQTCPKCNSPRVHRSRARTTLEHIRKFLTSERLHRCHACGWRGWGAETAAPLHTQVMRKASDAFDLSTLDK